MALLVVRVLKPGRIDPAGETPVTPTRKVPVWSLLLMSSAALAVSVAALPRRLAENLGVLLAGLLLVVAFIRVDRRMSVAVLPRSVFGPGPAKWIFLTMSVQMAAAMANTYVPLFGQKLADLSPAEAGFLGAALATGWTGSEIVSASLTDRRVIGRVVVAGPLMMAAGLALAAVTQRAYAPLGVVALWALALLITGAGIGIGWPHLAVRAMDSDDPEQSSAAAAAINTVQLVSAAFGAGLAGVVVNLAEADDATAARWLYLVFAVLAGSGVVASYRAVRDSR
jgi:MFS family permease